MSQLVQINHTSLEQLLYRELPVVTVQQIAEVHGVSPENVQKSFQRHRGRFTEGKHYFRLDFAEANQLGLRVQANSNGLNVFTEKGYLLLTKPLRDSKAWEVQERMVDAYFATTSLRQESEGSVLVRLAMAYERQEMLQRQMTQDMLAMQAQTIATQAKTIEAHELATRALEAQLWMTLRQYRYVNNLYRQLNDADLKTFATYLSGYCLEHGIPVAAEPVADRVWGKENKYHVPTIAELLPVWLSRRDSQPQLH